MTNGTDGLSANTEAILLLTAPLVVGNRRAREQILTAAEYRRLAPCLASLKSEPADLLGPGADRLLAQCGDVIDETRLRALLDRGFLLSQAVDRWRTRGIWVVSRADAAYPPLLKQRLKNDAPSVLYGCGMQEIVHTRSFAIVGSREVTEPLIEYTRGTAGLVAGAGFTVVSGGARGVDRAAMNGALEAGGTVVGVLPGDLERTVMNREHRNLLLEERLVLLSLFDPSQRFTVAQAMQRNKVIYALAEAGLVVNADVNRGGTWAGAVEQLKKYAVPVFVRSNGDPSAGLEALLDRGAHRWPEPEDPDAVNEIIGQGSPRHESAIRPSRAVRRPGSRYNGAGSRTRACRYITTKRRIMPDSAFKTSRRTIGSICAEPRKVDAYCRRVGTAEGRSQQSWLERLVYDGVLRMSAGQRLRSARDSSIPSERAYDQGAGTVDCLSRRNS